MWNKRWVMNENIVESKISHQLFRDLRSKNVLGKSVTKNNFPRRMPKSAYRHLFCYKKALDIIIFHDPSTTPTTTLRLSLRPPKFVGRDPQPSGLTPLDS